jgi:hypothetical protein
MTSMLTTGEQQELCQVEQDLRNADRLFAWRLALLQGMRCWAGPGRRVYLLALAVLAAALVRLVAAVGRLPMAFAEGAMFMEPAALMAFGDTARPGRGPGQAPGHSASPAQDRLRSDGAVR